MPLKRPKTALKKEFYTSSKVKGVMRLTVNSQPIPLKKFGWVKNTLNMIEFKWAVKI